MKYGKRMSLVAICAALLTFTGGAAQAETVWRFSSFIPATHFLNAGAILPWAKEVEKITEGRVRIEMTPKVVGSPAAQYDAVRDALTDLATVVPGYTPGRFDLAAIGEQPMLSDDPTVAAVAFQRLYDTYLKGTGLFNEVHVLAAYTVSPGHFFMRDVEVKTLADLKGKKIRAAVASTIPTLTALGAIPVQKPSTEMYELLSSGVLDGTVAGLDQVGAFKLADVTKHATIIPGGLFNSVLLLALNKDSWNSISEEDRAAISAISGEALALKLGQTFIDPIKNGTEIMLAAGNTVEVASPQLAANISEKLKPVRAGILEMAKKNGIKNPEEMMAWYLGQISILGKK